MKKIFVFALTTLLATFAACSNANDTTTLNANTNTTNSNTTNTATTNTTNADTGNAVHHADSNDDVPAAVRAAITDGQIFTKQHKDIPANTAASIEKETNTKITDRDHHSYLAFSTAGGARRQVGAVTVVNAGGLEMIVVYDSKEGSPVIREVRGADVPAAFLNQFKGKNHDDALKFKQDIKAQGANETLAQAATNAIKADVLVMQALYGAAHTH